MTINQMANIGYGYRNMAVNYASAVKSLQKLSSGHKINSAADNPAGLAISEKMRTQIGGLTKASENAQAGVSLIQTADGALDTASSILTRMSELAVQASNGTYSNSDRALLNEEFDALKESLNNIASSTNYNGINLLDGSLDITLQVGASGSSDQQVSLEAGNMSALGLNLDSLSITTRQGASEALSAIEGAIDQVSMQRAGLGASQNRLEHSINNLSVTTINTQASESTIRDTDMALEMINFVQKSIQTQASQAMMAQGMNLSRQYMLGILMR